MSSLVVRTAQLVPILIHPNRPLSYVGTIVQTLKNVALPVPLRETVRPVTSDDKCHWPTC